MTPYHIVSRVDDFAAQVGSNLDELAWDRKREIIRVLVRRVEIGLEQIQVVFRVDALPGESDPEKKVCNFVGGVISPVLANMTLDGLETIRRKQYPKTGSQAMQGKHKKGHLIRYADDFIITGHSKEVLATEVQPRGLPSGTRAGTLGRENQDNAY